MKDIERWLQKGLIDQNLADILTEEQKQTKAKYGKIAMQIALYTIGAIFLGLGIITFISANDWFLELFKKFKFLPILLVLLLAVLSLIGGYKIAYEKKNFPRLGNSLIFLSTILIGGCYTLAGIVYNWYDTVSSIFSLWFISIFPLAFIFKSKAINILSTILFVILFPCFYNDLKIDTADVWTIFIPFSLAGILYTFANNKIISEKYGEFANFYKFISIYALFITLMILVFSAEESYQMTRYEYITIPAVLIAINAYYYFKNNDLIKKMESLFFIGIMAFMLILLIFEAVNPIFIHILAHFFIIIMISEGIYIAYKTENIPKINQNNLFLLIYILSIYCRYGWSYLHKSIFFTIGGILLISLGIFLEKQKKKFLTKQNEENA